MSPNNQPSLLEQVQIRVRLEEDIHGVPGCVEHVRDCVATHLVVPQDRVDVSSTQSLDQKPTVYLEAVVEGDDLVLEVGFENNVPVPVQKLVFELLQPEEALAA